MAAQNFKTSIQIQIQPSLQCHLLSSSLPTIFKNHHKLLNPITLKFHPIQASNHKYVTPTSQQPQQEDDGIPIEHVKTLVKFKSRHNYIRVLEVSRGADHPLAGSRLLLLDAPGNIHSISFLFKSITNAYYDVLATLPPILPPGPLGILGFGAGSAAKLILEMYPQGVIHGYELDPAVISVGREYFGLSKVEKQYPDRLFIYISNALSASVKDGYSGFIVDLFSKGGLIPELQNPKTWVKLKGKLKKGGKIMVNVGGSCVEPEDSRKNGKFIMEETLKAMNKVFEGEVFVLNLGNRKQEDSTVAIAGGLPDLDKMSPALSLSASQFPLCKSQDFSKDSYNTKISNKETPCQKTHSDTRINRRKLLSTSGLSLVAGTVSKPARAETEAPVEATSSRMSYSRFLEYLNQGAVKKVDFFENSAVAEILINPALNKVQRVKIQLPGLSPELVRKLRDKNVDFSAHLPEMNVIGPLLDLLGNLAFPLILLGSLLLRSSSNTPGGPNLPFGLGRSKAKFQMEPNTGVTFDDVAGVNEAKQDFQEIVEFLRTPEKFAAVGAKIPKGVLLVGPPGTGKTLLAKVIAGEAGVPFFSLSGSEFIEMFVGVGASRVRDLFNKAKQNSPCIIFIDEIDAVGRQRGTGIGGGNDEREQTLNQLLTEMDGFTGNTGVIVIAATNRPEILDQALLRPGRFDRQVSVGLPDIRGREEILKVHSNQKKLDKDVSLSVIAMRTPGFSGADLANLMNEAAILAGRRGKDKITSKEIDDLIDRIVAGMEGTTMTDGKNKILVAYHEVGHAVCATLTPGHDAVQKVTLIPRGQARGLTWFIPGEDPTLISKQQLFARIVGGLGGRAAEEIIFGEPEITTGAAGDLQQITQIARQMVTMFGMSEIGPWTLTDPAAQSGDVVLRMLARNQMSEKLAEDIDASVRHIIDRAYEIAKNHIRNNREAIDKLVDVLLEKETLTGDEFRALLSEFTDIPSANINSKPIRELIEA